MRFVFILILFSFIVYAPDADSESLPYYSPHSALRGDTENTPLQMKLSDLAELIA